MVRLGGGAIRTSPSGVRETYLGRRCRCRCGGGAGEAGVRSGILLRGSQHVEPHLKAELVVRHLPGPIWTMSSMPRTLMPSSSHSDSATADTDTTRDPGEYNSSSNDTDAVVPVLSLHDFCPAIHEVQVRKNRKRLSVFELYYTKLVQTNKKDHQPFPNPNPNPNPNPPVPTSSLSVPCLVLPPSFAKCYQQYTTTDRASAAATTTKEEVEEKEDQYYYCFYSLKDRTVWGVKNQNKRLLAWEMNHLLPTNARCIGSSYGWLAYHNPFSHVCPLYLFRHPPLSSRDFFSHSHMFRLPPVETLPDFTSVRSLKTTGTSSPSVTRDYSFGDLGCWTSEEMGENVLKVVLSSAPSLSSSENDGCIAVACISDQALAFCKLGDTHWTTLDTTLRSYDDLIYSQKDRRFHVLYSNDTLGLRVRFVETWDLTHPSSPKRTVIQAKDPDPSRTEYLVESNGDLYKVGRTVDIVGDDDGTNTISSVPIRGGRIFFEPELLRTIRFKVRKLDHAKQVWEAVDGIGDRSFFVGLHSSFSLSTRRFPHLKSNCIYFTDSKSGYQDDDRCGIGQDMGIFHLRDNTIEQLYPCDRHIDARINICPAPFWVAPP